MCLLTSSVTLTSSLSNVDDKFVELEMYVPNQLITGAIQRLHFVFNYLFFSGDATEITLRDLKPASDYFVR